MSGKNLGRTLGDRWRAQSDRAALYRGPRRKGEPVEVETAGRLQSHITRLAIALSQEILQRESLDLTALQPGTRVLIASPARAEALAVALAVWSVGGVTVLLAPDLPEKTLGAAIARAKAELIVVDSRRTLGGLELAADDAISRASVVLIDDPPEKPVPRMIGLDKLLELGGKHRAVSLERLARAIFAVPENARAAILYWEEGGELKATALEHSDLLTALVPLPRRWALSPDDRIFTTLPLGDREALLLTLRALAAGHALAFPGTLELERTIAEAAPQGLFTDAATLESILDGLDRADRGLSVRGALKHGLGWLERRRDDEGEGVATQLVVNPLGTWAERGLATMLKRDLGGHLRLVFCHGRPPAAEAQDLLRAAGVELATTA